ncbi:hypothetical protein EXU57_20525 [Segetibacter sp. 3557_3]|uniref:hypothetical protein n=1 Tax=Segetibacter sp. 3557_3 TaxID=2547429 RepID=UPI00105919DB|nr:hypothetical protein [Segetibacter sp. 3557_3]TDH21324.1 hypothetical protein EXU57_20525 [Segetibacter sp. 3557_3]
MKKVLMFAGAVTAVIVASRFFADGGGGVKNGRVGERSGTRGSNIAGVADESGVNILSSKGGGGVGNGFEGGVENLVL